MAVAAFYTWRVAPDDWLIVSVDVLHLASVARPKLSLIHVIGGCQVSRLETLHEKYF